MKEAVLLVGHGSKDPEGNKEFEDFAARAGMRHCMLDYVEPSLPTALALLAAEGVSELAVIPYFLFAGGHVKKDIPFIIQNAQAQYPRMRIRLGRHLGLETALFETSVARLQGIEGRKVLLVGRGSLHPEPIRDMATVCQTLRTCTGHPDIDHCFIALAPPDLPTGITHNYCADHRPPIVLPYFLFTGILVKRIIKISEQYGCEVRPHLGTHEALLTLVHQRKTEILEGADHANDYRSASH